MVFVFKVGTAPHTNNLCAGKSGRCRTSGWGYVGDSTMTNNRMDELEMHPNVKPVALVADALLDVTKRGEWDLDPFWSSGTTLVAAEKTGQAAGSSSPTRFIAMSSYADW
jgi:DNA modification methylase